MHPHEIFPYIILFRAIEVPISKCSSSHHPSGTATTQDLELFIIIFPHIVILIIIAILALRWNYNHHGWLDPPANSEPLGTGRKAML